MSDHRIGRRAFVETTFAAMATALLFPSAAGSAPAPADEIVRINIEDFPELMEINRSARIMVTTLGHGLLVTRISENSYAAVSDLCTHQGCSINDFDPSIQAYLCPCHGSRFDVVGNVIIGPAPVPLERYEAVREGETVVIRSMTSGVEEERTVVGVEHVGIVGGRVDVALRIDRAADVLFVLHAIDGREALRIDAGLLGPGTHRLAAEASELPAGGYVGVLSVGGKPRIARKLIVR